MPVATWEVSFSSLTLVSLLYKVRINLYREVMSYREVVSYKLHRMMFIKAFYKLKDAILMCVIIKILGAWK